MADILLFPVPEDKPEKLSCPCGSLMFHMMSNWLVRCAACDEIVGFWNPFQPAS